MNIGRFFKRVIVILFSYFASVIAAAAVASTILFGTLHVFQSTNLSELIELISNFISNFLFMLFFVSLVIAFAAAPIWLLTTVFAEWFSIQSRNFYMSGGAFSALSLLISYSTQRGEDVSAMWCAGLCAGLIGGWVYWDLAGKKAGQWKLVEQH